MCGPLMLGALAGLLLAAVSWLGPPVAGRLIEASLAGAGLQATETAATVTTDPPLELLEGHADRVDVTATGVTVQGLEARDLELTMLDVNLGDRSFEEVQGRLSGVTFRTPEGAAIAADRIDIAGPARRATATVHIVGSVVQDLALEAIRRQTGLSIGSVTLAAPDRLVFEVVGFSIGGRFVVEPDGSLGLVLEVPGDPHVPLVAAAPLRLESVVVSGGELVLSGTIDVVGLLGG